MNNKGAAYRHRKLFHKGGLEHKGVRWGSKRNEEKQERTKTYVEVNPWYSGVAHKKCF